MASKILRCSAVFLLCGLMVISALTTAYANDAVDISDSSAAHDAMLPEPEKIEDITGAKYNEQELVYTADSQYTEPLPAEKDLEAADTVGLVSAINGYAGGTGSFTAVASGDTVTVTGSVTAASAQLNLSIDAGVKVVWQAEMAADPAYAGVLILVQGAGSFEASGNAAVTASKGIALSCESGDTSITISGNAAISETGDGGTAIKTDANLEVLGGTVSAATGVAVHSTGSATQIIIKGGRVHSQTAEAVKVLQSNTTITVTGGTVSVDNGIAIHTTGPVSIEGGEVSVLSSGIAIDATESVEVKSGTVKTVASMGIQCTKTVTISGGLVQIDGDGGYAISSTDNVYVSGGKVVSTAASAAINSMLNVYISGTAQVLGTSALSKGIISNGNVEVTGGQVFTKEQVAVYVQAYNSVVTVSGGCVFAYGGDITGAGNVIESAINASAFDGPAGNGVVAAWDKAKGTTQYQMGTSTDIKYLPAGAQVYWAIDNNVDGIRYSNGDNTGFIPLAPVVTVVKTALGGSVAINHPSGLQPGKTLELDTSLITPAGAEYTVEWFRDGVKISGSTGTNYVLTNEDLGKNISAVVTGTGNYAGSLTAPAVAVPYDKPGKPTNLSAMAGDGFAVLEWAAPVYDGGRPVEGYQVSLDGGANWIDAGNLKSYKFTGLENGKTYTLFVRAYNAVGTGEPALISVVLQTRYTLKVVDGTDVTAKTSYLEGDIVEITTVKELNGKVFDGWISDKGVVFEDAKNPQTKFTMPANNVIVTAVFKTGIVEKTFSLNIVGGKDVSGKGKYKKGEVVKIKANMPPKGEKFISWESSGVVFKNKTSPETTFVMPGKDVKVTAVFKEIQDGYIYETITDKAAGVSVTGYFTPESEIKVKPHELHEKGSCLGCDEIRAMGTYVAVYDISVTGKYKGGIKVSIPVATRYNNKNMKIVHCLITHTETVRTVAANGYVSGEFTSLSPFAVFEEPSASPAGAPQTNDNTNLWIYVFLLALFCTTTITAFLNITKLKKRDKAGKTR